MKPSLNNEIEILLVEDNPADVRLVQEVFKEASIHNKMQLALDGDKAMQILRKEDEYANVSRPDLIILDLNLPKKDGREVLKEIKEDENLKSIPVVILTTSNAEDDLIETYRNNANCYITKPVDLDNFIKVVKIIEDFWLSIVKLPPRC
ncbi:MAG: response regulator [Methanobacteriaceae archaeon]|jgi:two-component system, chemotaxis family, response regulator Rcp1